MPAFVLFINKHKLIIDPDINSNNFNFEKGQYNWLNLSWKGNNGNAIRNGNFKQEVYKVVGWERVVE